MFFDGQCALSGKVTGALVRTQEAAPVPTLILPFGHPHAGRITIYCTAQAYDIKGLQQYLEGKGFRCGMGLPGACVPGHFCQVHQTGYAGGA